MKKTNDSGFTLFEIVTVVAIIAIISAIVVPNLLEASKRSKLKSDIQTMRTVQNAIDLYRAENRKAPASTGTTENDIAKSVMDVLYTTGYTKNSADDPQTENAKWTFNSTTSTLGLDISSAGFDTSYVENVLTADDKTVVKYESSAEAQVK